MSLFQNSFAEMSLTFLTMFELILYNLLLSRDLPERLSAFRVILNES